MADSIDFVLEDKAVLDRLQQLTTRLGADGMRPAYMAIGELLTESTKQRFETSTAPDGSRWAPLKEGTILARLAKISGSFTKKSGKLSAKGVRAVTGMHPLVETGLLMDSIHWQLIPNGVAIGTNRFSGEWDGGAAVHQFGNVKGTIPARPFLGLSADDRVEVLDILGHFLASA